MSICSVGAEGEGEKLAVAYLFQKFASCELGQLVLFTERSMTLLVAKCQRHAETFASL